METSINKQLEAERVRNIYANSSFAMAVLFSIASILSVYLWPHISHSRILAWYSANLLAIALHFALYRRFRNTEPGVIDYSKWKHIITASFALRGIATGSGGILLYSHSAIPQSALVLVMAGLVGGAVTSYHMMKHISIIFCVALLAPLSYSFFTCEMGNHAILGAFCLIYMAAMSAATLKLHVIHEGNILLRFKTESLAGALRESQERYKSVVSTSPLGIHITDVEGKLVLSNQAHHRIFEAPEGSLVGQYVWDLLADDPEKEKLKEYLKYLAEEQPPPTPVYSVNKTFAGNLIDVKVDWNYIRDDSGSVMGFCTIVEDITEKKKTEDALKQALDDKGMLIREAHHRAKNNFAVIQSLLSLQVKDINDEKSKEYFADAQSRVKGMTMIHDMLQATADIKRLELSQHIRNFVDSLFNSYNIRPDHIKLRYEIQDIALDVNTVIPLGLIINELVSNALKYAFPDETKGELVISLKSIDENSYELLIKDSGVGLPEDFNLKKAKSLGLRIVNSLTKQINGTLEVSKKDGAEFRIAFTERPFE